MRRAARSLSTETKIEYRPGSPAPAEYWNLFIFLSPSPGLSGRDRFPLHEIMATVYSVGPHLEAGLGLERPPVFLTVDAGPFGAIPATLPPSARLVFFLVFHSLYLLVDQAEGDLLNFRINPVFPLIFQLPAQVHSDLVLHLFGSRSLPVKLPGPDDLSILDLIQCVNCLNLMHLSFSFTQTNGPGPLPSS